MIKHKISGSLPKDAKRGTYEVVAGVGSSVDTTSFEVVVTAQSGIISIDELSAATKKGTALVLPYKVTVRYDNNTSRQVAVTWDSIALEKMISQKQKYRELWCIPAI